MGKLPSLLYGDGRVRQQNLTFGGVDYTPGCAPGSWEATENVSSREYPAIVPRPPREVTATHEGATAMYVHGKMALVIGTAFYYDGVKIGNVSPGRKQIAVVEDWLVIWPDKIYYNMADGTFAAQELTLPLTETVGLTPTGRQLKIPAKGYVYTSTGPGATITGYGYGGSAPTVLAHKKSWPDYWETQAMHLNKLSRGDTVYIDEQAYSVDSVATEKRLYWPGVYHDYVTVNLSDIMTISGWAEDKSGTTVDQKRTYCKKWKNSYDYTNNVVVWEELHGTHYINELKIGDIVAFDEATQAYEQIDYIDRTLYTDHYYYNGITTKRYEIAQMIINPSPETIITENAITTADRLRLTAGGATVETSYVSHDDTAITFADSVAVLAGKGDITIQRIADPDLDYIVAHQNRLWGVRGKKIYASKQGDPKVFASETATQIDPWNTDVGTDGDWTGIASLSGDLLAFKEHIVHKVIGTLPENYQVYTYNIEGIKKGCHASTAIIGEVLYYYAPGGVYAYAGAAPSLVSANFGTRRFGNAVGGTDGRNLYLSMQDEDSGEWGLYVLDTIRGIWLREDNLQVGNFDQYEGELYALDMDTGRVLRFGSEEERVAWSVTTGKLFEGMLNRRRYTKAILRADITDGAAITIEVSHDDGEWTPLYRHATAHGKTLVMPILPRRTDNFRLRISGKGFVRIRGLAREYKEGSEL